MNPAARRNEDSATAPVLHMAMELSVGSSLAQVGDIRMPAMKSKAAYPISTIVNA
jgi:hypothetical protein